MKNLKMFAIAIMAFAVMAMGVHATTVPGSSYKYESTACSATNSCLAKIGEHYYSNFNAALLDAVANNGTIELLTNVPNTKLGTSIATGVKLTKSITIDLGTYTLDLGSNVFEVDDKATLTIKGTGEVKTTGDYVADVKDGGSFVTEGALLLTATKAAATTAGKVVIGAGAEVSIGSESVVTVTAHTADVTINATVGTSSRRLAGPIVDLSGITVDPARNTSGAKVTIAGGAYYLSATAFTVKNGVTLVVSDGTIDVDGKTAIAVGGNGIVELNGGKVLSTARVLSLAASVNGGKVTVNGSELRSTADDTIVVNSGAHGTLTIKKGTIVAELAGKTALSLRGGDAIVKIEGATLESGKDTPAIYIDDTLLTGIAEGGAADNFKGMVTGGKFLYMIIGGTADGKYTPADVTKYILGAGLEEKTEGNYKLVGAGANDEPEAQEPGTTEPGTQTPGESNPNVPDVPKTSDAILVYAGLGLVSALSVKFTSRKKEN